MTNFELIDGSAGLSIEEVAHVFIPGRGRNASGDGLTDSGIARVDCAADFYSFQGLESRGGVLVPSGYKTPAENNGAVWSPEDDPSQMFIGIPEAELMRLRLLEKGVGALAIHAERFSIDTVTNFAYAENGHRGEGSYFPDDRPVAIVAQEAHLERMIKIIAPRTLRREYIGIIVPEAEPKEPDSRIARAFSQVALLGIYPETENAVQRTTKRVTRMWQGVNLIRKVLRARELPIYNQTQNDC